MAHLLRKFGDGRIEEGDVFIANHPYHGATHANDVIIAMPMYAEDRLMGFAATNAHHMDVGGKTAASEAADATEVWQEGLLLPLVKLYGRASPTTRSSTSSAPTCASPRRRSATSARRSPPAAPASGASPRSASVTAPTRCRASSPTCGTPPKPWSADGLRRLRFGTYRAVGHMDPDLYGDGLLRLEVAVTVSEEGVHADFTGTAPQARGSLNCPLASTVSSVWYAVRCMIEADVPQNEGAYRPVSTHVPEGSPAEPDLPGCR